MAVISWDTDGLWLLMISDFWINSANKSHTIQIFEILSENVVSAGLNVSFLLSSTASSPVFTLMTAAVT